MCNGDVTSVQKSVFGFTLPRTFLWKCSPRMPAWHGTLHGLQRRVKVVEFSVLSPAHTTLGGLAEEQVPVCVTDGGFHDEESIERFVAEVEFGEALMRISTAGKA